MLGLAIVLKILHFVVMEIQNGWESFAQQAKHHIETGNYPKALRNYAEAIIAARQISNNALIAVLFNRLGDVLQKHGKIQDSVIAYEAAVSTCLLKESSDLTAESLLAGLRLSGRSGKGYVASLDPLPGLYTAPEPETLLLAVSQPALLSELYLDVGNAYLRQLQAKPALFAYQQALEAPGIEKSSLIKAYILTNIGEVHRRQADLDLAADYLNRATRIFIEQDNSEEIRGAIALSARLACDRNQEKVAESQYKEAIALYEQAKDTLGTGRTCGELARLYLSQAQFEKAQDYYQRAITFANAENDIDTLWHSQWGLGRCQQNAEQYTEAVASYEKSIALIEQRHADLRTDESKVTLLDSTQMIFDQLLSLQLDLAHIGEGHYAKALAVAERSRGLSLKGFIDYRTRRRSALQPPTLPPSKMAAVSGNVNPTVQSELALLHGLIALGPTPIQQGAPGINASASWPVSSSQKYPLTSQNANRLTESTATNQNLKQPPQPRLVFHVLADRMAIFVVPDPETVIVKVILVGREQLDQKVTQLRNLLNVDEAKLRTTRDLTPREELLQISARSEALNQLLLELYEMLIAPVEEGLTKTHSQILVIEPHAALWRLPFSALKRNDGSYLCDLWALLYAHSAQTLEEIRNSSPYASPDHSQALIVGNPVMPIVSTGDGTKQLKELPGAEKEARKISVLFEEKHLKCELLIGADATEKKIRELAQSHNVLHLSTHGIAYTQDPLDSFIVFSPTDEHDGLLRAREIASYRNFPTDLVVLSACQTGLGRISGGGMLGLSRAFLIAGARSVITSQWSVDDESTDELMVAFYKCFLEGKNKAIALQKAMQSLRRQSVYAHPYFWAAFTLAGTDT